MLRAELTADQSSVISDHFGTFFFTSNFLGKTKMKMKMRRQSLGQLSKGDQVEVKRPNGANYAATVLRLPSTMQKNMVFVEYQAVYEGSARVKGYVDVSNVRPLPPLELNRCFKIGDSVDAYRENGWREGVVREILENSKYIVGFGEKEEESEVEQCNLRLHREWDDGSWVPPLTELTKSTEEKDNTSRKVKVKFVLGKRPKDATFQKEDEVEVTSDEEGFRGSWYKAIIVEYIGNNDKYLVEYLNLMTEDRRPLREEAEARHVRPCPPNLSYVASFRLGEVVDAWYNDGWWVGVISRVLTKSIYSVYFGLTNEELDFHHSSLRLHQDWMNGKWIIASEEKSGQPVTNSNKLHKMDVDEKMFQANFPIGMKVEVKSDEKGYEGSRFSAVIIDSLGYDKYLVEYQTLITEDQDAFLREEAYASYIRPPPLAQCANRYELFENVDAWYNDGWWIGQIVKVLTGWRYAVYFRTTNELLEFEHNDLRLHQEWINGKWVTDSRVAS
ncbi:hypothetical protein PTKIN_Ptkin09bG0004800 [Pterospermum kingtungense]